MNGTLPRGRTYPANPQQAGFSLIEIVLCLGIVAFAFIGVVGLLPLGLANFRGAVDTSTSAQIFQRVMNDAKQTDFDQLVPAAGAGGFYLLTSRFFDDQGNEKTAAAGSIYHVRVRGSRPNTAFTSLPGTTTRFTPANSTFLTVQVAVNPGNRTIAIDGATQLWQGKDAVGSVVPMSTYPAIVSRH